MKPPIHPHYFADPFIWVHLDRAYAIGTGLHEANGDLPAGEAVFPLLQSTDFRHWEPAGKALDPPSPDLGHTFWAPEVAFANGLFWLYYSVGFHDRQHQIRVASSLHPLGPYRDIRALVFPSNLPFAIDPHPFRDDDGRWYLFYATDSLTGDRPGTVIAVDRLVEMDEVAGEEKIILRARRDWQRFRANRPMYGGIYDWHTLEGPFVRKHNGLYTCFYSGGCWEDETYGVDYATSETVLGPYSDAGNEHGPRLLRSLPGALIGPGHHSIFATPRGAEYVAFHAWNRERTARLPHLSPLHWTPHGPRCDDSPAAPAIAS